MLNFCCKKTFLAFETRHQYADCFRKPLMQENQSALLSHMDRLPENLESIKYQQEDRYHQDIKKIETGY